MGQQLWWHLDVSRKYNDNWLNASDEFGIVCDTATAQPESSKCSCTDSGRTVL